MRKRLNSMEIVIEMLQAIEYMKYMDRCLRSFSIEVFDSEVSDEVSFGHYSLGYHIRAGRSVIHFKNLKPMAELLDAALCWLTSDVETDYSDSDDDDNDYLACRARFEKIKAAKAKPVPVESLDDKKYKALIEEIKKRRIRRNRPWNYVHSEGKNASLINYI